MPAWINRKADRSIYDWEVHIEVPGSIGKCYKCRRTGKMIVSEALPKNKGEKIFVMLGGEWKEDKTEYVKEMIHRHEVIKDIIE